MDIRLRGKEWLIIGRYLGGIVTLVALTMLIPVVVALIYREFSEIPSFLLSAGIALCLGGVLRLLPANPHDISGKHAIVVTGLAWLIVSVLGAVPLQMSGHYASFTDALFESISGFTTTGLSTAVDVNHMSMAVNTWRFETILIGGQGVLVAALALGLFSRQSRLAVAMFRSEGRDEKVTPNIRDTGRFIWRVSAFALLISTAVGFIAMLVIGMRADKAFFHGLWIAIAAFDTGGFSPQGNGLVYYHSVILEVVVCLAGFMGALNFALYIDASRSRRDVIRDIEVRTLVVWAALIVLVAVVSMMRNGTLPNLLAMCRRGVFMVLAGITNTGLMTLYPAQLLPCMGAGAVMTLVIAMTIGGCTNSASGGIKVLRVALIGKAIAGTVKRAVLPDSAKSSVSYRHHKGKRVLSDADVTAACTVTVLYIVAYAAGAIIGIVMGYDAISAMFESVSAATNNGLSSGIVSASCPMALKVIYMVEMLLGRFEFITVFVLLMTFAGSMLPKRVEDALRVRLARRASRKGGQGR